MLVANKESVTSLAGQEKQSTDQETRRLAAQAFDSL